MQAGRGQRAPTTVGIEAALLLALLTATSAACRPPHGPCALNDDCAVSAICIEAVCRDRCTDVGSCAAGELCRLGGCLPALTDCTDSQQCRVSESCYAGRCHALCVDTMGCRSDERCVDGICLLRPLPQLAAGNWHSCAVTAGPAVHCWGGNGSGQLGVGDSTTRGDQPGQLGATLPKVDLGADFVPAAIACGESFSCARSVAGAVKCWGDNRVGQLGLGDIDNRGTSRVQLGSALHAVDLGTDRPAIAIAAGKQHACALLEDGAIKCWGGNSSGQLGLGDSIDRGSGPSQLGSDLPAVDLGTRCQAYELGAGEERSCAICAQGVVKCWGSNQYGELGVGDFESRGDQPDEMGHQLPGVALGIGRRGIGLALGVFHTCAIVDDGSVRCWGANNLGQLGLGDNAPRGEATTLGNALPAVDLGGALALALAAGDSHTCALLDRGGVKCWGNNNRGQLGQGDTINRGGTDAPALGNTLAPIDLAATDGLVGLAAGWYHSCAQLSDGQIKCWGYNAYGQLGLGDIDNRGDAPREMGSALPAVDLGAP